jgi:serine/threonine-protein phosphatase 2A regulatory subunit B''
MVGAFRRLNDLQNATPFSSAAAAAAASSCSPTAGGPSSTTTSTSGSVGFAGLRLGSTANAVLALRAVNVSNPSGLQAEQQQKLLALLQSSSASPTPAAASMKLRTVELFQHWGSLESTALAVEELIAGFMVSAGIKGFSPQAPAPGAKKTSPSSPVSKNHGIATTSSSSSSLSAAATAASDRSSATPPQTTPRAGQASTTDEPPEISLPTGISQPLQQQEETFRMSVQDTSATSAGEEPAEAEPSVACSSATVAGMEEMPFSHSATVSSTDDSPKRKQAHHNRTTFVSPKSPRHMPSASSAFLSHIVDEVDAAHARGALSPRSISPNLQLNQDLPAVPQSPIDASLGGHFHAAGGLLQTPAPPATPANMVEMLLQRRNNNSPSADSAHSTPRKPHDEGAGAGGGGGAGGPLGRPSRSPSPSQRSLSDSERSLLGKPPSGLAATLPHVEEKRTKYATYQEIPRFHFAEGRPQTQSMTLTGPHSTKHDNPHLTLFEGVSLPMGGLALGPGGVPQTPQGPKIAPMLPLAVMEDEDVLPFINKEFARLPAPPPRAAPPPAVGGGRLAPTAKGGASVLRRPTTSSGHQHNKQEQAYRQALSTTMHRVCSQAFGLPRYFASLVLKKLLADSENQQQADESPGGSGGGNGGGIVLARPGTGGSTVSQQQQLCAHITPAAVKEFYEKYIRFKGIVRRMFEVLVATSRANPATLLTAALQSSTTTSSSSAASQSLLGGGGVGIPSPAMVSGMNISSLGAATGGVLGLNPSANSSSSSADSSISGRRNFLIREDFQGYLDIILESHPGLGFLRQTADFQTKYVETVIHRIFFDLDRLDRGRISWTEFETSRLPDAFRQVDATDDINTVLNYFSYEHFYVLYCRFWELDEDRDMHLSPQDLQRYGPEGTMNPKIVERVFQGHGRRLVSKVKAKMCYEDFVWFCLSEEDKCHPRAIRYWFKILDLDSDGILSGYELETFYAFTKKQLMQMTSEGIAYVDVVCQIKDMMPIDTSSKAAFSNSMMKMVTNSSPLSASNTMYISESSASSVGSLPGLRLGDLLANPHAAFVAMNMLTNVVKFLQFEQRDPFVVHHDRLVGGYERCEWDRFARVEYDRMAQEADEQQ